MFLWPIITCQSDYEENRLKPKLHAYLRNRNAMGHLKAFFRLQRKWRMMRHQLILSVNKM